MQLACSGCGKEMIGYGTLTVLLADDEEETDRPYILTSEGQRVFPMHPVCWEEMWGEVIKTEKAMVIQLISGSVEDIKIGLGMYDEEGGESNGEAETG